MSLNKLFKQEVESQQWAVNHNIPKGFLHGLAAVSVSLSLFVLSCASPKPFLLCPEWENRNVRELDDSQLGHLILSCCFLISKLKGETGVRCGSRVSESGPLALFYDVIGQAAVC